MTVKHTLISLDMRVFALCSLMELHRGQEAGTRPEALYTLCHCQRSHHLRYGTDARPVQHRAGDDLYHYEFGGLFFAATDNAAG